MRTVSLAPMWKDTDLHSASVSDGYSVVGKSERVMRVAAPKRIITLIMGTSRGGFELTRMPLDEDLLVD